MRTLLASTALGLALAAGATVAHAQMIVAQEPVVTTVPAPIVTAPAETIETVRTVHSTTTPRHRRVAHRTADRVTTTRTVVSQQIVPEAPAVAAIPQPGYAEMIPPPPIAAAPGPQLYDAVTPGPGAAPAPYMPAYRYVYEPDRILVIDPYTNIAVQSIPR